MAPVIDINPLVLKDVVLEIGEHDMRKHVDSVLLQPATSPLTWTGLGKNSHTDPGSETWSAQLSYAQDWETPDSLSRYLFEHSGETVQGTFKPRSGTGPEFAVDLVLVSGAVGGAVNAFATTTVTLGISGRPVLVDPVIP